MGSYRGWLFYVPAILAVLFMIWVLFKFTQQLAASERSQPDPEADPRYVRVVTAAASKEMQVSARDF